MYCHAANESKPCGNAHYCPEGSNVGEQCNITVRGVGGAGGGKGVGEGGGGRGGVERRTMKR